MSFFGPEKIRTLSDPTKFGSRAVFNRSRVDSLREMIASNALDTRMRQKWTGILAADSTYQPIGPVDPFSLPSFYDDPDANRAVTGIIDSDGTRAVDLGIRYQVLGNEADAQAVARILTPWTGIQELVNNGDSRLVWSNRWPLFIQAAQLIEESEAYTPALSVAMQEMTRRGVAMSTAPVQTENRAMWGCMLEVTAGAFLDDRPLFDRAIRRFRELFTHDVRGNIPVGETERESNGLYYCNFLLNAMTQTAEIARFNGEWLYDTTGPDGSTFRGLWETIAEWTADPGSYPYWEGSSTVRIQAHVDPLHALWPTDSSQRLIDQYTTTQDFVGYRAGMLAYRYRPLYG